MPTDEATPPRRTDKPEESVTVTGKLFPWDKDHPVTFFPVGSPLPHMMLFDTEAMLHVFMRTVCEGDEYTIKLIENGPEFLASVPGSIVVAVNPWFTDEGKVRYTQLQREK